MVKFYSCLLTLFAFLLVSCGKSSSGGGGSTNLASSINVSFSKIKGFVIAPPTTARRSDFNFFEMSLLFRDTTSTQNLYSLNNDGSLTLVTVTTGDQGKTSTSSQTTSPTAIYDTVKFTFFEYHCEPAPGGGAVKYNGQDCCEVAARKSDSALFCVGPAAQTGPSYFSYIVSDTTGNTVFVDSSNGSVFKLDFTNPASATQTTIVDGPTDGAAQDFAVNGDGDVLVDFVNGPTRLYKISGGLTNLQAGKESCLVSGAANDATSLYYIYADNSVPGGQNVVHQLVKSSGSYNDNAYFTDTGGSVGVGCGGPSGATVGAVAKTSDRIFTLGNKPLGGGVGANYILEMVGPSNKSVTRQGPSGFASFSGVYPYSGGVVALGKDTNGNSGLALFTESGAAFSSLLPPGNYSISSVSVGSSGEISFYGRRNSDSARILGSIPAPPASPTVTIVNQTLSGDVQQIQRIN